MEGKNQKVTDGTLALLYIFFLWGSAYFVPSVWFFLETKIPWHNRLPQLLAGLFFLILAGSLQKQPLHLFIFFLLAVGFFSSMGSLRRPIEQIHFIEYGLLSFFLFRTLRHTVRAPWGYGVTCLAASAVGMVDELIQGLLPNRVFDVRDIGINIWAGALGMAIFACFLTPKTL